MLSPYFPVWLVGLISPLFAWLGTKIVGTYKPIVLFALCLAVVVAVIAATPLGWESIVDQTVILFGLVAGAYTIAKPVERIGRPGGAVVAVLAGALVVGFALVVRAQDSLTALAPVAAAAPAVPAPPVGETVNTWLVWGVAALGAVVARWFRGRR